MSTDAELISWLRRTPLYDSTGDAIDGPPDEAADRLAALISERDRLKEALAPFAALPPVVYSVTDGAPLYAAHYWAVVGHPDKSHFTREDLARARTVLSPTQEKGE